MAYYKQISATAKVKSSQSALIGIVVSSTSSGTIALYDSEAVSTSIKVIDTITPAAGAVLYFGPEGITFSKGIYAVIANTLSVTLIYK